MWQQTYDEFEPQQNAEQLARYRKPKTKLAEQHNDGESQQASKERGHQEQG